MKVQFVTKAWPDIQKKLQKLDNWAEMGSNLILREAQKVYVNRDEVKTKTKRKVTAYNAVPKYSVISVRKRDTWRDGAH